MEDSTIPAPHEAPPSTFLTPLPTESVHRVILEMVNGD